MDDKIIDELLGQEEIEDYSDVNKIYEEQENDNKIIEEDNYEEE